MDGDNHWMHWDDLFDTAAEIGFTEEAMLFMRENTEGLCLSEAWYEHRVDKPAVSLINELHMTNHAAREILAQTATTGNAA